MERIIALIIAIGLLVFFSGTGTLFNFVFLRETGNVGTWIATIICVCIAWSVICYHKVKEKWSMSKMLCIVGVFGLAQMLILCTIETPHFWDEDGFFVRIAAAWGFQPVVCLVGTWISTMVEEHFDNMTKELMSETQTVIKGKLESLHKIESKLSNMEHEYRSADRLVDLVSLISKDGLDEAYKQNQIQQCNETIQNIDEICKKNMLGIKVKGQTLSQIAKNVREEINNKNRKLQWFVTTNVSRKNYSEIKGMLNAEKNR